MANRLEVVGEGPETPVQQPQAERATTALFWALKALSARAVIAIASLVDAALVASAFMLWWNIIGGPTVLQIVTASIYSGFILAIVFIRRRE